MPLSACSILDCENAPAPGSAFCPGHLATQRAASAGISEPEVEEAAARAAAVFEQEERQRLAENAEAVRMSVAGMPPDPTTLEPHWDGTQWVLRPKQRDDTFDRMKRIQGLVRELMAEVEIEEADRYE